MTDAEIPQFEESLRFPAIHRAQSGLVTDLDYVADVLYGRAQKRQAEQLTEVPVHS